MEQPGREDRRVESQTLADTGYDVTVTPSIDTVERTVTIDGKDFTVDAIGKVFPGDEFTVTVTSTKEEEYSIEVRDLEEFVVRNAPQKQGDTTVTFDSGTTEYKDALQPRSYGVAPIISGNVKAFHPLVVCGYEVSVRAPPTALNGTEIQATIEKLPSERDVPSIDHLEAAIWSDGSETRHTMEQVSADTYRTAIDKSAGDYNLAVAVINTDLSDEYDSEPIAFSDPQPLTVVENDQQLAEDWTISADSRFQYARPAVDTERVFVAGLGEDIIAHDRAADGGERWRIQRDGSLSDASPVLANGTLYVASGGGSLYAIDPDAAQGDRISWTVSFDSALTATPAVLDGRIYAGTNDGRVLARDTSDGSKYWTTSVGGPVYSAVETSADTVFVTTGDGDVVALGTDGVEQWRYNTKATLGAAAPVHRNDTVYVAGEQVVALDAASGSKQWDTTNYHGSVGSTPAVGTDTVYVGDRAGFVHAFDATDGGARKWAFGFPGSVASQPAIVNDRLIVADTSGTVGILKRDTGAWARGCTLGTRLRSPVFLESGDAFVGGKNGTLAVFEGI